MGGEQLMQLIYLHDDTDSIAVKRYAKRPEDKEEFKKLSVGDVIVVKGRSTYDSVCQRCHYTC
jgi:DNA polymerase III alpha subunit (gram-positive type)